MWMPWCRMEYSRHAVTSSQTFSLPLTGTLWMLWRSSAWSHCIHCPWEASPTAFTHQSSSAVSLHLTTLHLEISPVSGVGLAPPLCLVIFKPKLVLPLCFSFCNCPLRSSLPAHFDGLAGMSDFFILRQEQRGDWSCLKFFHYRWDRQAELGGSAVQADWAESQGDAQPSEKLAALSLSIASTWVAEKS